MFTVQYASDGLLAQTSISKPPKQPSMKLGAACLIDTCLCFGRPLPPITPTYSVPCSQVGMLTKYATLERPRRSRCLTDGLIYTLQGCFVCRPQQTAAATANSAVTDQVTNQQVHDATAQRRRDLVAEMQSATLWLSHPLSCANPVSIKAEGLWNGYLRTVRDSSFKLQLALGAAPCMPIFWLLRLGTTQHTGHLRVITQSVRKCG